MRLAADQARARFAAQRVARLATLTPQGHPHLVPFVFALADSTLYTAVDAKPKSTPALRRLDNIAAHAEVSVLADHYTEDWTQLWWVRGDGTARLADGSEADTALSLLAGRYGQYATTALPGPVIAIDVLRWAGWAAALE